MSTVVVVKRDGNAAIGADTLVKYGEVKEPAEVTRNFSKIVRVGDSYLAFVGHASFGLVLNSYFSRLANVPPLDSRQSIFSTACRMHEVLKRDYFMNTTEDEDDTFESSQLECLIANPSGIFGLYSMRFVQEYSSYYAFGSGAQFALGALHACYDSGASVEQLAEKALQAAAAFDDGTQGPFDIHSIPKTSQTGGAVQV